jgi:predicted dehydrogenase
MTGGGEGPTGAGGRVAGAGALRVCVVGLGRAGRAQLHWWGQDPRVRVVGVVDPDRTARRTAAARGLPAHEELAAALVERPDLVSLCGPPATRPEQAAAAFAAGCHVLCEKPLANSLAAVQSILDAAAASGRRGFVMLNLRRHPVVAAVETALPRVGPVHHVSIAYTQHRSAVTWRHRPGQGGGVLKEQGVHVFDLLHRWVDGVASVSAETTVVHPGRAMEDHAVATGRAGSGATFHVYASYVDDQPEAMRGELVAGQGRIEFVLSPYDPRLNRVRVRTGHAEEPIRLRRHDAVDPVYPGLLDATGRTLRHVVDALATGGTSDLALAAGRAALEPALAGYVSARTGRRVALPLDDWGEQRVEEFTPRLDPGVPIGGSA